MSAQSPEAVIPSFTIARSSPVPLYFQVATQLEQAILSGQIPAGARFANEIQLAEDLGLSRPTMRRAMQHLSDNGLVVRRRGIGTRVVQPKVRRKLELTSLYDDLVNTGQRPTTDLIGLDLIDADDEVAAHLDLKAGDGVYLLKRLRSANGRPIAKMTNYLPERYVTFGADELADHGLYELLRRQGVQLHSANQTIGARPAAAAESKLLDEPRGAALLTMQRITYDDHGTAVELGVHVYAASRYSFEVSLLTS